MRNVNNSLDYNGLLKLYNEGFFTTSVFIRMLVENGWFDRYLAEFIEMVNSDLSSFEKAASKA